MNQLEFDFGRVKRRTRKNPKEWKLVALRDCPTPQELQLCDTPALAAEYWRQHVVKNPYFNPYQEAFVVLLLNTRRRILGHVVVTIGTLSEVHVHAREVFRPAIVGGAHAILVMHNHPGGDPSPSEADIRATRDLIRAGQLLRLEVLDHVIVGNPGFTSLKETGFFYQ